MKRKRAIFLGVVVVAIGLMSLHLLGGEALAGEADSSMRGTYDMVMRILNFLILAFVLVKFAKKPLMGFLRGEKEKLAREIQLLEEEKEKTVAKVNATLTELENSKALLADLKERIISQGEKEKQAIIENARQQGQILLEGSKAKTEWMFQTAKNAFQSELVDGAMALAMEKLPKVITVEDNQRMVNEYLTNPAIQ